MSSILYNGKMSVENQTKTQENSILCPETSPKNAVREFHLRIDNTHNGYEAGG